MKEALKNLLGGVWQARGLTVLGLIAGVAGFAFARHYLATADRSIAARYANSYAPRRVLVASSELPAGATLSADRLAVRSMPQRFLPSGALPEEALDSVIAATLRAPMKPGDPLQSGLLRQAPPSLATQLPPGSRGLSLGCEALGSLGAMLQVGDRLDVWLAGESGGMATSDGAHAVTDVLVVDTGLGAGADAERPDAAGLCTLTLRVTPAQAGQFLAAAASGGIAAVLRPRTEPPSSDPVSTPVAVPTRRPWVRATVANALELLSADGHELSRHWLTAEAQP